MVHCNVGDAGMIPGQRPETKEVAGKDEKCDE
jgi:hypothetical protein